MLHISNRHNADAAAVPDRCAESARYALLVTRDPGNRWRLCVTTTSIPSASADSPESSESSESSESGRRRIWQERQRIVGPKKSTGASCATLDVCEASCHFAVGGNLLNACTCGLDLVSSASTSRCTTDPTRILPQPALGLLSFPFLSAMRSLFWIALVSLATALKFPVLQIRRDVSSNSRINPLKSFNNFAATGHSNAIS